MKAKKILAIFLIVSIYSNSPKSLAKGEPLASDEIIELLSSICSADDINKISTEELFNRINKTMPNLAELANNLKQISAEELKQKISEKNKNLKVVNVLGKRFFEDCNIKDSINCPLKILVKEVKDWDRNLEIISYCAHEECNASEKASIVFICLGFKNVSEYIGGIKEWYTKKYPTCGSCKYDYLLDTENV